MGIISLVLLAKRKKLLGSLLTRLKLLRPSVQNVYKSIGQQNKRVRTLRDSVKEAGKRRWWVRPIYRDRKIFGAWYSLVPQMRAEDPEAFYKFFRMSVEAFDRLLDLVAIHLQKRSWREPICPGERLAITLRYYASGSSYGDLAFLFRCSDEVISNIVLETSTVLWTVLEPLVFEPFTEDMWLRVASEFETLWNFPHCVGTVDGKHVFMKNPAHGGSRFFNYKKRFSMVLMGVADAKRKLIYIDVGASGRRGDSDIFNNTSFAKGLFSQTINLPPPCPFEGVEGNLPFLLLGDGAFEKSTNLVNPFPKTSGILSAPLRVFNTRFSGARHCIEDVFGMLFKRYGVFSNVMEGTKTTVRYVILACCALHNYHLLDDRSVPPTRIRKKPQHYYDFIDEEGTLVRGRYKNEDPEGEREALSRLKRNVASARRRQDGEDTLLGEQIREILLEYFIEYPTPGQWKKACV